MPFRTTIIQGAGTATGIQVPQGVVAALGSGKRPAVSITINGFIYRSAIAVMGGVFMVGVNADNRAAAEQLTWLTTDLAANPRECVLAFWHRPRFSSGTHGSDQTVAPLWSALYDAGAEVVVTGHDHDYERFAPMDGAGQAVDAGMREFVVGTGGEHLRDFERTQANSEVRWNGGYGVLKFELRTSDYSWEFVPTDESVEVDAGTGACR